jgi:hypothetical protein
MGYLKEIIVFISGPDPGPHSPVGGKKITE